MIVIGYQGIGKSSNRGFHMALSADKQSVYVDGIIDLESSNFWFNKSETDEKRVRWDNWYDVYCNIAEDLSSQGFVVFVSSHKQVRERLAKSKENVLAIFPAISLKNEWIAKLEERYQASVENHDEYETKNFKALANAKDRYEENISEIKNDCEKYNFVPIELRTMDYKILDIIRDVDDIEEELEEVDV